jgi:hypothetical protein
MTTYAVIIGSPPGGATLPSGGTFGSLGCRAKASTPAERLNMAFMECLGTADGLVQVVDEQRHAASRATSKGDASTAENKGEDGSTRTGGMRSCRLATRSCSRGLDGSSR